MILTKDIRNKRVFRFSSPMSKNKFVSVFSISFIVLSIAVAKGQHSFSQGKILSKSDDFEVSNGEILLKEKLTPENVNINELPFFGNYEKTEKQIEEDKCFLNDCKKSFKNNDEASQFFSDMAWQYLAEGNKAFATYRFNLAWLLKKNNSDVYWGLGVIYYQNGQKTKAIETMEKGIFISPKKDVNLMLDLATILLKEYTVENNYLTKSQNLLNEIIALNPKYISAYQQLCVINLIKKEPKQAWENFYKAYQIDPSNVNTNVLEELKAQMPDPMGKF